MLEGPKIGAVIPACNEAENIEGVLSSVPPFVGRIIVVDDGSSDGTAGVVKRMATNDPRIVLLEHETNKGPGAALATGYLKALEEGLDVVVRCDGDGQMDPEEMERIVRPVLDGRADYAKGNRFMSGEAWRVMPRVRFFGTAILSLLTKVASGYWHVSDFQSGYTAISKDTLSRLPLNSLYPGYGHPNQILVMLNVEGARVADVPIKPLYNVGERSKMRVWRVVLPLSFRLFYWFLWRLWNKYVVRDFHPLVFFYLLGLLFTSVGSFWWLVILAARLYLRKAFAGGLMPLFNAFSTPYAAIMATLLFISGLQLVLFAMWMDMDTNRDLRP